MSDSETTIAGQFTTGTKTETDRKFYEQVSEQQFADEYDVHAGFLPFRARPYDPLEMLGGIATTIEAIPGTAQTITRHRVLSLLDYDTSAGRAAWLDTAMFLAHGAYPLSGPDDAGGGAKFANPRYISTGSDGLTTVRATAERHDWLDRYTALGTADLEQIAPHFGLAYSGLRDFIHRTDYPYQDRKTAGRVRLARTWKTIQSWGYTGGEIGDAFGVSGKAVRGLYHQKAYDFEPPADPTTEVADE